MPVLSRALIYAPPPFARTQAAFDEIAAANAGMVATLATDEPLIPRMELPAVLRTALSGSMPTTEVFGEAI